MTKVLVGVIVGLVIALLGGAAVWKLFPSQGSEVQVGQINLEKMELVHRTEYARTEISAALVGKEPQLRGLLESTRILVTTGFCLGGIDHEKNPPDVDSNPPARSVTIRVGEPELLDCGITDARLFDGAGFIPASSELNNQLYSEAQRQTRENGLKSGLLDQAKKNALDKIELALRKLGFTKVDVLFKSSRR